MSTRKRRRVYSVCSVSSPPIRDGLDTASRGLFTHVWGLKYKCDLTEYPSYYVVSRGAVQDRAESGIYALNLVRVSARDQPALRNKH